MKKFINAVLIVIITSISLGIIAESGIFVFLYSRSQVFIDESLLELPKDNSKTVLYYYNSNDISKPEVLTDNISNSSLKYTFVPLSKIPADLTNAFIAIEDKRFYKHNGVDFLRSSKAIFNYVMHRSSSFGASTITQQVIKNLTGDDERTPKRKINEIFLALNLEKTHTKEEILETYLNIINLSNGCMGVGAACMYYFSKYPEDLTLEESATIAAITNNPSLYNPKTRPDNTVLRRNLVLLCMYEQGYITQNEYIITKDLPLTLNITQSESTKNSWFVETVISDLLEEFTAQGMSKRHAYNKIFNGGLRVYTTVNTSIQNILDNYYEALDLSTKDNPSPQSSMIVINPYNGDILGVAGAIGKKRGELLQNYATATKRPPGSAIKPLSVYAPLIDQKIINWSTIVEDSPVTEISGRPWPQNANRIYSGNVDISDAVANSINTVSVKMLYMLGEQNSLSFLRDRLHIKNLVIPKDNNTGDANAVSLGLGQTLNGITLRELTSAYSIFTEGNMSASRSYYKVTDSNGNIIFDNRKNQENVISHESAAIMTKLMQEVIKSGTACGKVSLNNSIEVAGKTGTTQNNCDRLFVAYTPSLLAGVWCGYDYPKPLDNKLKNPSIKIWDDIMNEIYRTTEYRDAPTAFKYPESIQKMPYDQNTGESPSDIDFSEDIRYGWFVCE